jgi:hypothetical protein
MNWLIDGIEVVLYFGFAFSRSEWTEFHISFQLPQFSKLFFGSNSHGFNASSACFQI